MALLSRKARARKPFPFRGLRRRRPHGRDRLHGAHIDVSWGGISPWQTINVTAWQLSDMAVGDFDGDGRADLFLATGTQWFFAPSGKDWAPLAFSIVSPRKSAFRRLDSRRTHTSSACPQGRWQVAGLGMSWTPIGSAPVSSTAGLVVADFDGDGFADVAQTQAI